MFTDMVDSTKRAAELGDRRWKHLLSAQNSSHRAWDRLIG
jgi:hypothetical protein